MDGIVKNSASGSSAPIPTGASSILGAGSSALRSSSVRSAFDSIGTSLSLDAGSSLSAEEPNEEKMVASGPVAGRSGLEAAEQSGINDSSMLDHAQKVAAEGSSLYPSQDLEAAQA